MSQTPVLRATSLVASGAMLAAIAIAALTMSITLGSDPTPPPGSPITMVRPDPPAPPPRPRPTRIQPPISPDAAPTDTELMPPLEPFEDIAATDAGPFVADPLLTITRPQWVRRPSGLAAYYPRRALERGIAGDVLLQCVVNTTGLLECEVASETPTGWGFGPAAIRMARDHRMVPAMHDGVAVAARYEMRVPFRVE